MQVLYRWRFVYGPLTVILPLYFDSDSVLSARGGQHAPRGGCGGSAEVGVVVVGLGAGQDGVAVGGGAVEL